MIIKNRMPWLQMLVTFRGSTLESTWTRILAATVLASVVTFVEMQILDDFAIGLRTFSLTTTPFTLIGVALGIFLGFRNNVAYDRFWEGRKLWGALVNVSRSFTRQVCTLINAPADADLADQDDVAALQRLLATRTIAYVHSLRHHLRRSDPFEDLAAYLSDVEIEHLRTQNNVPIAILQETGQLIRGAWRQGWIHELHLPVLEESLTEMTAIQGGCERIKNTPIPFDYNILIHRIVAFYCFFLCFGIVDTVKQMTPPVVLLISYAFFGLDAIGDELEDPFGTGPHDLPLTALSRTIEINVRQQIGETDVPAMVEP